MHEIPVPNRPGHRFEPIEERLLDDDLLNLAARLPGTHQSLYISREVNGPRGVADLVATTNVGAELKHRIELGLLPLTSVVECTIVAAASERRTLRIPTIARTLGMSEEQVDRRVRSLLSRDYLRSAGSGIRRVPHMTAIGRTYALEAKVNDWRKGLNQALRYGAWCDASAVVLLRPPRDISMAFSACRQFGIGLAVDNRWLLRPRLGQPQPGMRLAASELWVQNVIHQRPSAAA